MEYRVFSDYEKGFSHEKNGTKCEDHAASYTDPDGRFFICAACDGHSDSNCFRSSKGARFGCEAAIEVLTRFFELLYEEKVKNIAIDRSVEDRLKKSIKQSWDQKVLEDILAYPVKEEEMAPLSERVRNYYKSGRGLHNIYGATFLAVAISKDHCISLHIGDGTILFINDDGTYSIPLEDDEKSGMGSPASLCDNDLFTRPHAFRSKISNTIPMAAIVSSDGIGDCMDQCQFMENIYGLLIKFADLEGDDNCTSSLNAAQNDYLKSFVKYYAEKGNGVEDDCSLAGIYAFKERVPQVKVSLDIAEQMLRDAVRERNEVVEDYGKRKAESLDNVNRLKQRLVGSSSKDLLERIEKIENLTEALKNIIKNETEKVGYYDEKIRMCEEYVKRAGGFPLRGTSLMPVGPVDHAVFDEDLDHSDQITKGCLRI